MPKKSIDGVDVAGKRVLVRVDFNVPIEDGRVVDDRRIQAAVPTIRSVIDRGGRAILLSHMGRPGGKGYEPAHSLRVVAERLAELLDRPVSFPSTDCTDDASREAVVAMADGDVVLLENLRFHAGEKVGDAAFASALAELGEIYCNDAFGAAHRNDASMLALPKVMAGRPRVAGLLLLKELRFLRDALASPARPFVVVLGGAKVSDKIGVIEHLMPRSDATLIGGAMAYTFAQALGRRTGESLVEKDKIPLARKLVDEAARLKHDMYVPDDHVCSTQMSATGGDIEVFEGHIAEGFMGLDIGPRTQGIYAEVIRKARTIVWNGPMGVFEMPPFAIGTRTVASAIAQATDAGATSVVGGGDSAAAVERFGMAGRMTHISTGGGASLEMLAGRDFESVRVLDDA